MKAGITGHQEIGSPGEISWVGNALEGAIRDYSITLGYTSLAAGADQLFAELLQKAKLSYIVIIPCTRYEDSFRNPECLEKYHALLAGATSVVRLPSDIPTEQAFWEAGQKVVSLSDIMFAVWDGLPAKGLGGTADVVHYARSQRKRVIQINPREHLVSKI